MKRRFEKSFRSVVSKSFPPAARADRIVPELTRFMIKYNKSGSKAHWTREWATQSLARRFSSSKEAVPQKSLPSLEEGRLFYGDSFNRYLWKAGLVETLSVGNKPVVYTHLGEEVDDWITDDYDPSAHDDTRTLLSRPKRCAIPCYCRLHCPTVVGMVDCVTCENYSAVTATESSLHEWAYMLSGFESHANRCRSRRARRYRVIKRSHEGWRPGAGSEFGCTNNYNRDGLFVGRLGTYKAFFY